VPDLPLGFTNLLVPRQAELAERVKWFVRLRWLAVIGTLLAVPAGNRFMPYGLPAGGRILLLSGCLFALNVAYMLILHVLDQRQKGAVPSVRAIEILTKVQVVLDLLILTGMLHYAGGMQNPFSFYYIFHVILASILLTRRDAYEVAAVALALYAGMVLLEYYGRIESHTIVPTHDVPSTGYMLTVIVAIGTTLFIAAFMATTIMDRLRQKENELEQALRDVRHLEATKSRFLVLVSHEMRSPIVAIRSILDAIRVAYKPRLGDKPSEMLERAGERADSLLALTKDLLTLARQQSMQDASPSTEIVDMLDLTRKNVELFRTEAGEKQIVLKEEYAGANFGVRGDHDSMNLVISNLVSNAVRYTPSGGEVGISWTLDGPWAVFSVSDTGIGIPEADLQHIFKEFFRAENAKKFTASGTGMGLAITRNIVERCGGTISVQSVESRGTTFTVRLPAVGV